ncbi:MAG: cysteine desulfurase, partial [Lachnospiraceae bacterium]|nr:cysteine desulfurase [Lachnospiraceae bacterium]
MIAYLDNAATTRVLPEVADTMRDVMLNDFGNPSSKHEMGIAAEKYLTAARETIAKVLKCKPKEIYFTSGGTESNNQALIAAAEANKRTGMHIITSRIEHSSILKPCEELERRGFSVTYLPVNKNGQVEAETLKNALQDDTILVSIMHVNNEIGSVNDIAALSAVIKEANKDRDKKSRIIFHTDAIQSFGKIKVLPEKLGVDMLSVSGHKLHGPKGIGFIYVKDGTKVTPYIFGGGQEKGFRSGTQNVPGIAGLSTAVESIFKGHDEKIENLYKLKEYMIGGLTQIEGAHINGINGVDVRETAPHVVSVTFDGIKSEVLLNALSDKGVYISSGSACSSNRPELSGT